MKILLHYPFVPNYRVPVFNELASKNNIELVVMSAAESNDVTLLSKPIGWNFNHVNTLLKSYSIFNRVIDVEFGVLSHLFKLRKNIDYYIILSNPNIITSWIYSLMAKLFGIKVIFWGHGLLREDKGIKKFIRNVYYKIPDIHWLYGINGKKLLVESGIPTDKIKIIYNSLDYEKQKKIRESLFPKKENIRSELGLLETDFVIVTIGRLLKKLRIEQIINAIPHSSKLQLKIIIIGDGPEKESLKDLCIKLGVSNSVQFTGAIYDEKILGKYYTASDASVVMGVVGLAAMHSLAYGVPLITHSTIEEHCPEIEAVIPGVTGEFFKQNDMDSFLGAVDNVNMKRGYYKQSCIDEIERKYTPSRQVGLMMESLQDVI
jgi:glycosyltransferase involved in cell wall biosynthesis